MRRSKLLFDYLKKPAVVKVEFGLNVIAKMNGNPNFPSADPTIAKMTTDTTAFGNAIIAAEGGGPVQTAALHIAEQVWDTTFRKVGLYVEKIADGNAMIILSGGFNVAQQPDPAHRPEFIAEHGELPGEVFLKHKSAGRAAYLWQYAMDELPTDDEGWKLAGVSLQSYFTIHALESAKRYWFRAAVVDKEGQKAWCDPYSLLVL